jgi:hypothetical protein
MDDVRDSDFLQEVIKPAPHDMPYAEVDLYCVTKDLPANMLSVIAGPYSLACKQHVMELGQCLQKKKLGYLT